MFLGIIRVWQRNARVWRKYMLSSLVGNLGQPFLFLLAMGYGLGRDIPDLSGLTYLQFIAPGLTASAVMYSAAFETTYGSYTRLSTQNTFQAILMTPVSLEGVAYGEIAWGASKGLLSGVIMLAALPLFGVWPSAWTIMLLPLLFITGMLFSAWGLIMSALAGTYDFFNYFISLVITPLFLFSGIFFPLDSLPPATQKILLWLPLTPVVSMSRQLCYGRVSWPMLISGAFILLLTLLSCWVAALLLRRRLIQ